MKRMTVAEAAERLGVTQDAVRQRIRRNTIEHQRTGDGRVYVYLTEDDTRRDDVPYAVHDALVEELRDRVRSLEAANAEMRRLLAGMIERIPELEAPSEPSESPESAGEGSGSTQGREEPEETISRPWWRRWFGGE